VLAAKRAGVRLVLLPLANKEEVEALDADVTEGLKLQLVANASEIIDPLFTDHKYILVT
jgi:ATP-dependent Lon protease